MEKPVSLIPDPVDPPPDHLIYEALKTHESNLTDVAKALGVPRQVIAKRVNEVPILMEMCVNTREELVDLAEKQLTRLVSSGDPASVRYVTSTLGKERGYTQSVAGSGKNGAFVVEIRNFEDP